MNWNRDIQYKLVYSRYFQSDVKMFIQKTGLDYISALLVILITSIIHFILIKLKKSTFLGLILGICLAYPSYLYTERSFLVSSLLYMNISMSDKNDNIEVTKKFYCIDNNKDIILYDTNKKYLHKVNENIPLEINEEQNTVTIRLTKGYFSVPFLQRKNIDIKG